MVPVACTEAMIRWEGTRWKEQVAGRKEEEKEARGRDAKGGTAGRDEVAGHETATERGELAFTKHQNGTYRGPVISPYSLRTW